MNQKRVGILISYLNLIMGMVVNIFLTPLLITSLGDVDYSLYKVIQSFAGPLSMFHLGISTIVTRSIVQFGNNECYTEKDKRNTMALALLASGIMAVLVSIAGIAMCISIPSIYGENYSPESVALGQKIFLVFMLSTVIHMLTDAFSGCMVGHERFIITSSLQLSRTILKMILWIVLLSLGRGVLEITCVDLTISLITFLFSVGYSVLALHESPRLYYFDRKRLLEIISFGAAILLQAVVNQVNNNVDNIILGAFVSDKTIITMYSSALALYAVYNSLIAVVANFFLPKATSLVNKNASGEELTDFVIGPGRFQAILAVACILGFILFGRNFITVWIGEKYMNAYWVTLMLFIPVTIPLLENTMISVLDASLKRIYRSVMLVIMAVLNVAVSVFLVRFWGFWGVAVGTVLSLVIGHGLMMNVYYAKTFHLQIGRMFYSILKGILPAGLLAALLCLPLSVWLPDTLLFFLLKCASFMVLYSMFLLLFGLNLSEKKLILKMLHQKHC
jgi:O-antigen/teichoic acid export membrane protein